MVFISQAYKNYIHSEFALSSQLMASVLNPVSQESITHFMFKVFITWSYTLTPLIKNPKSPILQIFFLAPADTCKPA